MLRKLIPISVLRSLNNLVTKLVILRDRSKDRTNLPIAELSDEHLKNCKLLPNRTSFLEHMPKNAVVGEVGVDVGGFSKQIIDVTSPKKFHLIDNWNPSTKRYKSGHDIVKQLFSQQIDSGKVEINRGLSVETLGQFENDYFDWVYIDTVHDYLVTADELRISADKVKDDGIIAGHDYTSRENLTGAKYGVIEAVHEFCMENNWELVFLTIEVSGHNSFAIRKLK